jgi:hypothetical protein
LHEEEFAMRSVAAPECQTGDYPVLARSFRRSLVAENKSPHTISAYMEGVRLFGLHLESQGMPTDVAHIARERRMV